MESIKFAENKLGAKMGTPKVMPKEHAFAPVKYDVEELSQKEFNSDYKKVEALEVQTGSHVNYAPDTQILEQKDEKKDLKKDTKSDDIPMHKKVEEFVGKDKKESDDKKDKKEKVDDKKENAKLDAKIDKEIKPNLSDPKEIEKIKKEIKE